MGDEPRFYLVKESKAAELEKICSEYAPENKEEGKRQLEREIETVEPEKKCEKKVILSEKRHETRQQLKRVLRDVEEGKAVSASGKLVLSGTKSRMIEGSVTIGEKTPKLGEEETKVEMRMNIETPELREPIESYITAYGQIRRPTSEWEKEDILKSDLTSKVLVDGHFKYGEEKRSIRSTIVAYRSDEQKKFVEESEEWKTCSEDEKEGRK